MEGMENKVQEGMAESFYEQFAQPLEGRDEGTCGACTYDSKGGLVTDYESC